LSKRGALRYAARSCLAIPSAVSQSYDSPVVTKGRTGGGATGDPKGTPAARPVKADFFFFLFGAAAGAAAGTAASAAAGTAAAAGTTREEQVLLHDHEHALCEDLWDLRALFTSSTHKVSRLGSDECADAVVAQVLRALQLGETSRSVDPANSDPVGPLNDHIRNKRHSAGHL
jgi:hypothetical protein